MLDEVALRKPGFSEGAPVVLADGQEWTLPKAELVIYPDFVDAAPGEKGTVGGRRIVATFALSFGPEYDGDYRAAYGRGASEDAAELTEARFRIVVRALLKNYDLDDAALCALIAFTADDQGADLWGRINAAMTAPASSPASTEA